MDTIFIPTRRSWTISNFKKFTSNNSNNHQNFKSKNSNKDCENSFEKGILKRTNTRKSILKRVSTCEEIEALNEQNNQQQMSNLNIQESKEIIKDNGIKTRSAYGYKRKVLLRKLSQAALEEIRARMIKFSEYVEISEVEKYDRRGDKPWKRITPEQKEQIKRELNDFKAEMDVHEMARRFTRFHKE